MALKHFIGNLEIRRELVDRQPDNFTLKRDYQVALNYAGGAYEDRGDLGKAAEVYVLRRKVATEYAAADPRNTNWQRDVAAAESTLGGVLRLTGSLQEAERAYEHAIAIVRPIAEASPGVAIRQRDLADAALGLGLTNFERGALDAAAAEADSVERLLAPLVARGNDREATRRAAEARLLAADVAARRGDARQAQQLRETALTMVVSSQEANPEKRLLAVQARALLALNRAAEARPIVERLTSLGYRHPTLMKAVESSPNFTHRPPPTK
jgi:tetratricopeptide (TPR) repeat protein